ncbi:MAG: hypothetical protein Q7R45_03515 [Sulfuricaulis sp.]|nr:hypothetical protein [Sulfuricaulis sp.]
MNHAVETITLPIADILRGASTQTLAAALLERVKNSAAAPITARRALPSIGADFEGGIYAGLSIADNAPMALVLLPGDKKLTWNEAVTWAEKQGGVLPSRFDQLVLFKNLKTQFQETWYWSGEQSASNAAFAWFQLFGNGGQSYLRKSSSNRARAVRRLVIQ